MNTQKHTELPPIRLFWSHEDQEWVACSPHHLGLSWLDETPDRALAGFIKLLAESTEMDVRNERGDNIRTGSLGNASSLLKISALAKAAGINDRTLTSKLKRGTSLSDEEALKIEHALESVGLQIS